MHLADIADRRLQRRERGPAGAGSVGGHAPRASLHVDAARVFVNDAAMRVDASARQALAAMVDGDTLRTMLAALRRVLKVDASQHGRARGVVSPTTRSSAEAIRSHEAGRSREAGRAGRCARGAARLHPTRYAGLRACATFPAPAGLAACAVFLGLLVLGSTACSSRPPDEPKDYASRIAAAARGKGRVVRRKRRSDPPGEARDVPAAGVLPDRPRVQRAGRAEADQRPDDRRDADVDRHEPQDAPRRHPGVHAQGTADEADRVQRSRRPTPDRCSSRSAISPAAPRPIRPDASWISRATRRASTRSTSTAPTSRTATTIPPTSARIRLGEQAEDSDTGRRTDEKMKSAESLKYAAASGSAPARRSDSYF